MQIILVEPFFTGSHQQWAEEYAQHSQHEVCILSLEGRYWKWRMHGGAVTLANQFNQLHVAPDLLLASDMLDLSLFHSLTRQQFPNLKSAIYFHENQLNYPWSPTDQDIKLKRDNHYAFINYTSALSADAVFFNSAYHQHAFLNELPNFLKAFPDYPELQTVDAITEKSQVLYLGMDLKRFDLLKPTFKHPAKPLILWNHRWEYDKNPDAFFQALFQLSKEGLDFDLAVLGEKYRKYPPIFDEAKSKLSKHIVQWGYAKSFETYAHWLWKADILPVTSIHDFFGASVVQAIYCQCQALLPNRLAYPEHLPQSSSYLYESDHEMINKLREMIRNYAPKKIDEVEMVSGYDWSVMAPKYDEAFEQLTD